MKHKLTQTTTYIFIVFVSILVLSSICKKKNRAPETPTITVSPTSTYNRKPETYIAKATDPDNNQVRLIFDWGDNSVDTTEYNASAAEISWAHAWQIAGNYTIKVKAQDEKGLESEGSASVTVSVAYNKPPSVESIIGPGPSPYYTLPNKLIRVSTIARDTTDSVYVRFIHKKKKLTNYTKRNWIGPKVSGATFRDSITFTAGDTYIIRAIAKDTKGSESDTSLPYQVIVNSVLWEFHTYDPPGSTPDDTTDYEFYSSPALAQVSGVWRLFIGAIDGYFYALDPANGARKWRGTSVCATSPNFEEIAFNATPAVNEALGHIYCGSDEGELYCFTTTGSRKWRFPDSSYDGLTYEEFGSSAAFTASNRIYVGCDDYKLYALQDNITRADTVWTYYTGSEIASSPAIDAAGNVYFGDDSGYVTAIQPNRAPCWPRRRIGIGIASSPTLTTDRLYVGTDDGYLDALNLSNGTQIWRYTAGDGIRSSAVVGSDGSVYFGCNDGKLYALTSLGTPKSGFPIPLSDDELSSTPAITSDGNLVVYTSEDMVYSISPSGTILWRFPLPGYGKSHKTRHAKFETFLPSPTIGSDGTIFIASSNAGIYAIRGTSPLATPSTNLWPKFRHDLRNTGRVTGSK